MRTLVAYVAGCALSIIVAGCSDIETTMPSDLGYLTLNSRPCAVDHHASIVLFPLPEEFSAPREYTPILTYSSAEDLTIAYDGTEIRSGDSVPFGMVAINDSLPLELTSGIESTRYFLIFTGLPVVHISCVGIMNEPKMPGSIILTAPTEVHDVPASLAGIEYRGSFAQSFPKKPFGFDFRRRDDWSRKDNRSLLGMRSDDDWILDAAYVDASLMKNRICNDLFLDLWDIPHDPLGKSAVDGRFVELTLNGRYEGVYVLSERVDRKLLKIDKQGGVLFKAIDYRHDDEKKWFELKYPESYEIPAASTAWEEFCSFLEFIHYDESQYFYASILSIADINNIINYHILLLVSHAIDNDERNHYIAKDNNGKYFYVPWDLDHTFGYTEGWIDNYLTRRLMDDERYRIRLRDRWFELRADLLDETHLVERCNTYYTLLFEAGAYQRNRERWSEIADFELTFSYMIDRIPRRLSWLDSVMNSW